MDVSIVIPAFNESHKIQTDINEADRFLKRHSFSGEIIIVDDGSKDDTAGAAARSKVSGDVQLKVIRYDQNRGKGYAIHTGMLQTRGDIVMFIDSGNCIPFENACKGLDIIKRDLAEVAHGSRHLPESVIVKPHLKSRQITSYMFRKTLSWVMQIPSRLTDTQCGLKIYGGDIGRELYSLSRTNGFMFDIEVILLAAKRKYRIREFPVEWTADPDSRLSLLKILPNMIKELKAIRKYVKQI